MTVIDREACFTNEIVNDNIYSYENYEKVMKFIENKPAVENLYGALPDLFRSIDSNIGLRLSIFHDNEEKWNNLLVEIISDHNADELSNIENRLFEILENNKSLMPALAYTTISFR